jgi:membrane-associated PAP2 superfamily phosphatase
MNFLNKSRSATSQAMLKEKTRAVVRKIAKGVNRKIAVAKAMARMERPVEIIFLPSKKYLLAKLVLFSLLLIFSLFVFYRYNFDTSIQEYFFDSQFSEWILDRNQKSTRLIFYIAPKIIFGSVILFAVITAGNLAINATATKKNIHNFYRYLYVASSLLVVVLIVANIKKLTNIPCPNQIEQFGGVFRYQKIFALEMQPMQIKRFQCFPAGHATIGFAFYSLIYLARELRLKLLIFIFATFFGWLIGFYQIAKGAHFVSDTLVSMLLSFLVATTFAIIYHKYNNYKNYHSNY